MKSVSQKNIVQSECLPGSYDAIDIMKFIGAWMVVVIHTKPLQPYSAVWNTYTAEGICRIAVPFFFAVSGVFLYQKLERTTDRRQAFRICMRQSGRNFQMYFIWSAVYWIISFLTTGTVSRTVFAEQIRLFFCDASVYHFWYLVALIYAIPLMGIVFRWNRKYLIPLCVLPWIFRCIQFTYRWILGGKHNTLDNAILGFYQKHFELRSANDDNRHFLLAGSQKENELPMEKLDHYPYCAEYVGADPAVLFVAAKAPL